MDNNLHHSVREMEIHLPQGSSINNMLIDKGPSGLYGFIDAKIQESNHKFQSVRKEDDGLIIHNEQKVSFKTEHTLYEVLGQISFDLSELWISLHISDDATNKKHRFKLDLYDYQRIEAICEHLHGEHCFDKETLERDLYQLTNLLEQHRDNLLIEYTSNTNSKDSISELSPAAERQSVAILKKHKLLDRIDHLIEKSGVVGEKDCRLNLFIICSSYKMPYPIHGLIQGETGSGKSHLFKSIISMMPQEDVLDLTRITPKSFYNFREKDLLNKIFIIRNFNAISKEAQQAFRELQSLGYITSSSTKKDRFGNNIAVQHKVKAHFSSLIASSKADDEFHTTDECIVLGIDESQKQTERIIAAQNMKHAGLIDESEQESAALVLRNLIRVLRPYPVVNPYACSVILPLESRMRRRLNQQFHRFIAQITLLNQFQRQIDAQGRLVTTKEDIELAVEYFFTPIFLMIDELDSSTRLIFEQLKSYSLSRGSTTVFTQREIRQALNLTKTRTSQYFKELQELEYIQIVEGSSNRGYRYKIVHWDKLERIKERIKQQMISQIENLE